MHEWYQSINTIRTQYSEKILLRTENVGNNNILAEKCFFAPKYNNIRWYTIYTDDILCLYKMYIYS